MPLPPRPVVILDSCVLINLLATRKASRIASESAYQFGICSVVENESIYLRAADLGAPIEPVKLSPYVESGEFAVFKIRGHAEQELYVDYAAELDDGEAMSLALVRSRGFSMATDDRKARRLFTEEIADSNRLLSTPQILKDWSEKAGLDAAGLKQMLTEVSQRGRFLPNSSDAYFEWWSRATI